VSDPTADFAALQDAVAGTWSIERELGRGGMGIVYLARDVALDRPVAIKVLHPALASERPQRERFLREARTGARLAHPHIVPIYDVVEQDEFVFFVMGLIDGESLGERLRREGPMHHAVVERVLREVGWALAAAHAAGVLHRDVTVDNILLERNTGRALLADFGIAQEIDGGDVGHLIGTPAYLAPELIRGEAASPRSELYALGIVGWTMLCGRLPYLDEEPGRVLLKQLTEPIAPLSRAAARTPSRLARAIEALLVKDPAERPATVELWMASLEGRAVAARLAEPLQRWVTQRAAMRPFYALAVTTLGMLGPAATVLASGSTSAPMETLLRVLVIGGAVLITIQVGMAVRSARRAVQHGYRIEDLRLAIHQHLDEHHARGPEPPGTAGRLLRLIGRLSLLSFAAVIALLFVGQMPPLLPWGVSVWLWQHLMQLLLWSWMGFWAAKGLGFVVPARTMPVDDRRWRWRRRFWHSSLGARFLQVVSLGVRSSASAPTLHRPTELVIGLQIDDVWNALPHEARRGLDDLPATAAALRARVAELRRVLARLEGLGAADGEQVAAIRERLLSRRDAALAALERLRVLALRLSGQVSVEGEFTQHLRAARDLELSLLQDLGAHPDVRRLIRRRGTPTPSPSPSPA
jgi:hypothetical protein